MEEHTFLTSQEPSVPDLEKSEFTLSELKATFHLSDKSESEW